jgi:hypothetical protein
MAISRAWPKLIAGCRSITTLARLPAPQSLLSRNKATPNSVVEVFHNFASSKGFFFQKQGIN